MKYFPLHARRSAHISWLALLAVLMIAPATVPVRSFAQEAPAQVPVETPAHRHHHGAAENPSASETPLKEEQQENSFLNAPPVHKLAHLMHVEEPTARTIFLAINFAIIFLAIAIPLTRIMPKAFRQRTQTLRHSLDLARQATEEARQRLSAVEAKLAGLDKEIAAFRAQVEQDSVEDEKRIKAALKEESERIVASAEQEIGAAAMHARRGLRQFAADLAIEQAEKQIQLTPETDRALIHEFIGQIADSGQAADKSRVAGNGDAVLAGKGGRK